MAQSDIATCRSLEDQKIQSGVTYGREQTQCSASAESWLVQVEKILNSPHQMCGVSKNLCIYRVPRWFKSLKPEAYVPVVVSFGPYHHKINSELSRMDQHKLEAVERMLARLKIDETILNAEIQKSEYEIREYYEGPINLDGRALSLMLVMDACFILDFFRGKDNPHHGRRNSTHHAILNDILKLENQIPLFILINILQLECGTREDATTKLAAMLSNHYVFRGFPFQFSLDDDAESQLKEYMMNERPPFHLLDLYKMLITNLLTNSSAESITPFESNGYGGADNISNDRLYTPRAESLHKAGIKFQPGQLGFQKRRFGASTLSLPQIAIEDGTESWLRNLMAYEECQIPEANVISHFVRLLEDLIDSEKDVSVLRKCRVIQSLRGKDKDIARMFKGLSYEITLGSIENFDKVMKEARDHYEKSQWTVRVCSSLWR